MHFIHHNLVMAVLCSKPELCLIHLTSFQQIAALLFSPLPVFMMH